MLSRLFGRKSAAPPPTTVSTKQSVVIRDVTDADFDQVVLASEKPVVVDVWAEWCQPCHVMSAYVGFLAQEFAEQITVVALDADENPATCQRFNVLGLPTLLLINAGVEVERLVGVEEYQAIVRRISQMLETNRNANN